VLARLNSIPGVIEARVEASGQVFQLDCAPTADPVGIPSAALAVLGKAAAIPAGEDSEPEPGDLGDIEIWFNSRTVISLSLIEARILARLWGGAAAAYAGLDPDSANRFLAILFRELAREFKAMHAEGGTSQAGWYLSRFPEAFDRTLRGLDDAADSIQSRALRESLLKSLAV
jgi:hypothetical protein